MSAAAPPMPEVPGVRHRDVVVKGVRWHLAEAGDPSAPPVVLVHGWPQHWYAWRKVIPALAEDHHVLAPDLPGFGWSDAPRDWSYAKHELAAALVDLLDALELPSTKLVGHDWGGWAGFLACVQAPERFERYAALSIPTPWLDVDPPTPGNLARIGYQFLMASPVTGERLLRHVPRFVETVVRKGSHPTATWTDAEVQAFSHVFQRPEVA